MQRKLVVVSFSVFLFIVFSSSVNAQTTASTASRLKEQMQILKDQKKTAVSQIREETKAMMQAKRDEFKTRMQAIKDQRKKMLVERIDTKLSEVNKKHTDRFTEVLSKLQLLLDKITAKETETKVLADIKTAQAAIDTAMTAVEAQAAKTYIIQITDETKLRLDVGTTTSQLRQDLMATYKLVIDAKQAVQKLNTDKSIMKKEATSSANL